MELWRDPSNIKMKSMANHLKRLLQKINFMQSRWYCESCHKLVGVRHFDHCFNESGDFVCPFCRHTVSGRIREGLRSYNFNIDQIQPSDSVQLQREESISIIEKKWQARAGWVYYLLGSVSFGLLLLWSMNQTLRVTDLSGNTLVGMGILLIISLIFWYRSLQFMLNASRIMMKKDRLVVAQMPLSFSSLAVIPLDEIGSFSFWRNAAEKEPLQFSFRFEAIMKNGKKYFLAPCRNLAEALYLEKSLIELILIEKTEPPRSEEDFE